MKTLQKEQEAIVKNTTNSVLALVPHIDGFKHSSINDKADDIIRTALLSHEEKVVARIAEQLRQRDRELVATDQYDHYNGKGILAKFADSLTLPITDEKV